MFRFTCLVAENVSSLSAKLKAKAGRIFKPLDAHAHACFANLLYIYVVAKFYRLFKFYFIFRFKLIRIHYHTPPKKKIKFT